MNCHIVPRVYLRSWKISGYNDSIFIFNRNKDLNEGKQNNIGKLNGTNFVAKNIYLLGSEKHSYNFQLIEEFILIFNNFKNYKIFYNNNPINTVESFIVEYSNILKWEIKNEDNKIVSSKRIKAMIESLWKEKVEKMIEEFFSIHIENSWKEFLSYITNRLLLKKTWICKAEIKGAFLEFLSIQFCRRYENIRDLSIDLVIEIMINIFGSGDSSKNAFNELNSESFKQDIWLIQLYKYVKYYNGKKDCENNCVKTIIDLFDKQMQICFLISPCTTDFITSDNPCIYVKLNSGWPKAFSGIYLPINKRVCAFLCYNTTGKTKSKYLIANLSRKNTKYINNIIYEKCLSGVAYSDISISDLINRSPDIESWNQTFKDIGLMFVDTV